MSHLRGKRHQDALAALGGQGEPTVVIVDAPEEHQGPPGESAEVAERRKAGRKRVKKLRQRMASRSETRCR